MEARGCRNDSRVSLTRGGVTFVWIAPLQLSHNVLFIQQKDRGGIVCNALIMLRTLVLLSMSIFSLDM